MQQMVGVGRFSWLSAGPVGMGLVMSYNQSHPNQASWQSTKTHNTYHLLHIPRTHCYLLMMGN
jgi:hypothetical protein